MRTHVDHQDRQKSRRLTELKNKTAELERELSDTRMSLEREQADFSPAPVDAASEFTEAVRYGLEDDGYDAAEMSGIYAAMTSPRGPGTRDFAGHAPSPEARTKLLVNHGRRNAYARGLPGGRLTAILATAACAMLVTIGAMVLLRGGPAWPSSVATVQAQAERACQNPDVRSEPGQVNFACAKATRQILWVFALLTSGDNPNYADPRTGRVGLEPITPTQGGEIAWSLNLHQPYSPANPVHSLEVAARAINNIIGGATITGTSGSPVVQPGLESSSAGCLRYTGSAALTARRDFPRLCGEPVTSPAGQAALVADVYQKWVVGAAPQAARDAAVLFENAANPGDPRVQAILRRLAASRPSA